MGTFMSPIFRANSTDLASPSAWPITPRRKVRSRKISSSPPRAQNRWTGVWGRKRAHCCFHAPSNRDCTHSCRTVVLSISQLHLSKDNGNSNAEDKMPSSLCTTPVSDISRRTSFLKASTKYLCLRTSTLSPALTSAPPFSCTCPTNVCRVAFFPVRMTCMVELCLIHSRRKGISSSCTRESDTCTCHVCGRRKWLRVVD